MARGKGEGPMGTPNKGDGKMSYKDEVVHYLDTILDEIGTEEDGEPNSLQNTPEQNPEVQTKQMEDDIAGDFEENEEPDLAGMASEMVDLTLLDQDNAYQTYFRGVMKKHGATDIKHMSSDKKREFFKDVSNGWKKHKKVGESKEVVISEDYKAHFKSMMKKHGVKNIKNLEGSEKKAFFNKIDASWKSVKEQQIYEEYKKYFKYMMEQCGIEDFDRLSEIEQAEFMGLVNEAFQTVNELMQKPGQGYEKGILQGRSMGPREKSMMKSKLNKRFVRDRATKLDWAGADTVRQYNVRGKPQFAPRTSKVKEDLENIVTNELMQKPGAPIANPMSTYGNMIDKMKNQMRPERRARQIAAAKAARPVQK